MNTQRDPDVTIAAWLDAGPTRLPPVTREVVVRSIHVTPQRRPPLIRLSRRTPEMNGNAYRLAAAALAVVIVISAGVLLLGRSSSGSIGGPSASATPSPTETLQASSPTTSPSNPTTSPSSPTASPSSAIAPPTSASSPPARALSADDVGRTLRWGTYRVEDFAAPFTITLPAVLQGRRLWLGWTANELTPNSFSIAKSADDSFNIYLAVIDKIYRDPCHTADGPSVIGSGVDDLVAAFSAMPGFEVADLKDATVGGAAGRVFLFSNSINVAAANCSGTMLPFGTRAEDGRDVDVAIFGGETDRFWVVQAGPTRVLITVTDNRVKAMQPLLDSLSFGEGPSN